MRSTSEWMKFSIDVSKFGVYSDLRVGAVLVSDNNELIYYAYNNDIINQTWNTQVLEEIKNRQIKHIDSIYLTINTMTNGGEYDLKEILNYVSVNNLYIGLPDPKLTHLDDNDPALAKKFANRFDDQYQLEILKLNKHIYQESKQSIQNNLYYFKNRISDLIISELKNKGYTVQQQDFNSNKDKGKLIINLMNNFGISEAKAHNLVDSVLSEAFNQKYANYSYDNDIRSINDEWKKTFETCYRKRTSLPLLDNKILNVGVGGGNEAMALFKNCKNITFVDIAKGGLLKIREAMPWAKIVCASAEKLEGVLDEQFDLYVSLRTYNSSFFDIKQAINEAHRVLKTHSIIILSVANSFIISNTNSQINGLIIPGTDFIDVYRGVNKAKFIANQLEQSDFKSIDIIYTDTEIFITAITT